jgi:hypothetical protein
VVEQRLIDDARLARAGVDHLHLAACVCPRVACDVASIFRARVVGAV